jgi:hypothetical protein
MYCGMAPWATVGITEGTVATGAHGEHGDGAYVIGAIVGAHTGAGAGHTGYAGRLNQLHGHSGHRRAQQQPLAAGNAATSSKISSFFMILCLLMKQQRDYCFGRVV